MHVEMYLFILFYFYFIGFNGSQVFGEYEVLTPNIMSWNN